MTEHKTLTEALSAFQAELPDVSKGSTNPAFKSRYADLADVAKAVLPVLAKHGLAWVTMPDIGDSGPVLRYELRHASGEKIEGAWPMPDGLKAQEMGSWITYGRRYTLSAVTGVTPDDDDDGNGAKGATAVRGTRPRQEPARDRIASALQAVLAAKDLATLHTTWERVRAGGLDGIEALKEAHVTQTKALAGTKEPDLSDAWGPVAEVAK